MNYDQLIYTIYNSYIVSKDVNSIKPILSHLLSDYFGLSHTDEEWLMENTLNFFEQVRKEANESKSEGDAYYRNRTQFFGSFNDWSQSMRREIYISEQDDRKDDWSEMVILYQQLEYVVTYRILKDGAYSLHCYCFNLQNGQENTYDQIRATEFSEYYHSMFPDFYCRAEGGSDLYFKVSFNDWLSHWSLQSHERISELINVKIRGKYNELFFHGDN